MNTKSMNKLKESLCKTLEEFAQGGNISKSDLEPIKNLTESIKNLMKIEQMEEGGYSYGNGSWDAQGMYSNNGMSREGSSYGRYSREGGSYGNSGTMSGMHYVRGHYSRAEDETAMLKERIEEKMREGRLSQEDRVALYKAMELLD